jgi:hypothetical protein
MKGHGLSSTSRLHGYIPHLQTIDGNFSLYTNRCFKELSIPCLSGWFGRWIHCELLSISSLHSFRKLGFVKLQDTFSVYKFAPGSKSLQLHALVSIRNVGICSLIYYCLDYLLSSLIVLPYISEMVKVVRTHNVSIPMFSCTWHDITWTISYLNILLGESMFIWTFLLAYMFTTQCL